MQLIRSRGTLSLIMTGIKELNEKNDSIKMITRIKV